MTATRPRALALTFALCAAAALTGCPGDKGDDTAGGNGGNGGEAVDLDGDGYGAAADCDDASSAIFPGAPEKCNTLDDDCDGEIDEDPTDGVVAYADADADRWGVDVAVNICPGAAGYATASGDCDDANAAISPDAEEACDGVDNDCDTLIDEPGATGGSTYHLDRDGDGYGHPTQTGTACAPGDGYTDDATDCDDADPARSPGTQEKCANDLDDDCDGSVDEEDDAALETWYQDSDDDDYGVSTATTEACTRPEGYARVDGDCDDTDPDTHPDASDVADGVDNDCDGELDEGGSNFDGVFNYQEGEGSDPDERRCNQWWTTTGEEASRLCPGCEWTYSVEFTYNEADSLTDGDCFEEIFGIDFTWQLGLMSGYFGREDALALFYYGDWMPIFYANWDDASGELTWWYGEYEVYETWYDDEGDTGEVDVDSGVMPPPPPGRYGEYYTYWFYGHAGVLPYE